MSRFAIPDETPVCSRLSLIEQLARDGMSEARSFFPDTSQFSPQQAADIILFCVQQLPFVDNPPTVDLYQPVEDTIRNGGDCKARTALLLAGLWNRGIRAQALWIDQAGYDVNHVVGATSFDPFEIPDEVAVWEWAEPSIRGALIGESPYSAAIRLQDTRAIGQQKETR